MGVALLGAAVSLVPMACGGNEAAMRATLTRNDGCTYEGDTSPTAGMFTIEVENQTELHRPLRAPLPRRGLDGRRPPAGARPVPAAVREGRDASGATGLPVWPAPDVEAGATSALPADVPAGTYALVCFVDDDLPTKQIYIAEQLDVTE